MLFAQGGVFLMAAILCEVAGTTMMKLSGGFGNLVPSVLMFAFYAASLGSLTFALKYIDLGIAYAIWSGLGTTLIAIIGFYFFGDSITPQKAISILFIILGVVGLHFAGGVN